MERYECTYRVNYNKQYLEDILDEECKGKKKLSDASLKKKDDSWEMDFHVMGPVKPAKLATEIRHPASHKSCCFSKRWRNQCSSSQK